MTQDLDNQCERRPPARTSRDGVSAFATLLEFKHRRPQGEDVASAEIIRNLEFEEDAQVAVDLLFADYLEERALGHDILERLIGDIPQFADELPPQIAFHSAP